MTFYTGGSERVRINTSGNVGIGTASPGTTLEVFTASTTNGVRIRRFTPGDYYSELRQVDSPEGLAFIVGDGSSATEKMRIGGNGNVGIGTASPTYRFDVQTSTNVTQARFSNSSTGGATILSTAASQGIWAGGCDYNGTAFVARATTSSQIRTDGGLFSVFTNSGLTSGNTFTPTERMRIDASGNVGIGTSSPSGNFQISGGNPRIRFSNTAGTASTLFFGADSGVAWLGTETNSDCYFITNNAEKMRITAGGEVYIAGTADQGAYNLQVNGTGVWGAGAYVNGSDARLKDDITTLNDGLNVISQLRPVTFKYKPDYSKDQNVQTGFIAQELQTALEGKDYLDGIVQAGPNHLNVAYQSLIPILTKAIQEQQAMIDELKAKVAALEAK